MMNANEQEQAVHSITNAEYSSQIYREVDGITYEEYEEDSEMEEYLEISQPQPELVAIEEDAPSPASVDESQGVLGLRPSEFRSKKTCAICNKSYLNLPRHMVVHSQNRTKDHKCVHCGTAFLSKSGLLFHMEKHALAKPFKCEHCKANFVTKATLKTHISQRHTTFLCSFCGKHLSSIPSLERHVRTHTGDKPYVCETCGMCFAYDNVLRDHKLIHTDEKPHVCEVCGMRFRQRSAMKQHIQCIHENTRDFNCEICGDKFKTKRHLKLHTISKHSDNPPKYGPCTTCGLCYKTAFSLKRHVESHNRPYNCQICTKGFQSEDEYQNHINRYEGKKPIECGYCEKKFHAVTSAKRHVLSHVQNGEALKTEYEIEKQQKEPKAMKVEILTEVADDSTSESESSGEVANSNDFISDEETAADNEFISNREVTDTITSEQAQGHGDELSRLVALGSLAYEEEYGQDAKPDIKIPLQFINTLNANDTSSLVGEHGVTVSSTINVGDARNFVAQPDVIMPDESSGSFTELLNQTIDEENYPVQQYYNNGESLFNSPPEIPIPVTNNKREEQTICETCGKSTTNLILHQRTHNKIYIACHICGKTYSKQSMSYHMKTHREKQHSCTICGKKYTLNTLLKQHMSVHTGELPFQCQYCPKKFRLNKHLVVHNRTHTGEKPYSCRICGKGFAHTNARKDHERIHTGEKPHKCDVCGKTFTQRSSLRSHIAIHTTEKPFVCDICGSKHSRKHDLAKHSVIHNTERKMFKCEKCDKEFTGRYNWRVHMKWHDKFSCSVCSVRFTTEEQMIKHENRFKGKQSVSCGVCGQAYHSKNSLLQHMSKHTGEQKDKFKCVLCGFAFGGQMALKNHILKYYGLRPFTCLVCGRKFHLRSSGMKHAKTHLKNGESGDVNLEQAPELLT